MSDQSSQSDLGHRYIIVGGAGFIGSHFTDALLADTVVTAVTLYDNFSSGCEWHYERQTATSGCASCEATSKTWSASCDDGWP